MAVPSRCPPLVLSVFLFFLLSVHLRVLHSFPTRRSSDLRGGRPRASSKARRTCAAASAPASRRSRSDRKSTRLNSSHVKISYAVFCLKKKIAYIAGKIGRIIIISTFPFFSFHYCDIDSVA